MNYQELLDVLEALLNEQPNTISKLANTSAFINEYVDQLNWVGFYLYDGTHLTVGPFQGRVACSTIQLGRGVCGEAALKRETMVVKDVHQHENHIACDEHSRSEVVVPIFMDDKLFGVLDVDSPVVNRFDLELVIFFERIVTLLTKTIDN